MTRVPMIETEDGYGPDLDAVPDILRDHVTGARLDGDEYVVTFDGEDLRQELEALKGRTAQVERALDVTPPWEPGETVQVDDEREYEGTVYMCRQGHTTQADWTPPATPALWEPATP